MDFQDKEIKCKDCPNTFVFTAGEQAFFAEKQFQTPARCKDCRQRRKAEKDANGGQAPAQSRPVVVEQVARSGGGRHARSSRRHRDEQFE
jgi:hypothetical protein